MTTMRFYSVCGYYVRDDGTPGDLRSEDHLGAHADRAIDVFNERRRERPDLYWTIEWRLVA